MAFVSSARTTPEARDHQLGMQSKQFGRDVSFKINHFLFNALILELTILFWICTLHPLYFFLCELSHNFFSLLLFFTTYTLKLSRKYPFNPENIPNRKTSA